MGDMIRTVIIEDEPSIRKELEWYIKQEPDFELLGMVADVQDAISFIQSVRPQLVLMDIQLTDGTAFDILNQLGDIDFHIIFITAYNHFAIKAIKYGALDYLLKPIVETELKAALQRIRRLNSQALAQQQQQITVARSQKTEGDLNSHIVLNTMEYLQVLQLKDIIYCQSVGGYTNIFLASGKKVMISKPLKFYDEILPEKWFLRPHQSYLVNILCVDKFLKSGLLILKDKTEIPVSGRRKDYTIQRISNMRS